MVVVILKPEHSNRVSSGIVMSSDRSDLRAYLESVAADTCRITKPVDVESEIAALCSESTRPILFENLPGFDDFRLVDRLVVDRALQGQVLGCAPDRRR